MSGFSASGVFCTSRVWYKPSAETNSVQQTSGAPCFATSARKAASVTSAIGAITKNGLGRPCQNDFILHIVTVLDKYSDLVYGVNRQARQSPNFSPKSI